MAAVTSGSRWGRAQVRTVEEDPHLLPSSANPREPTRVEKVNMRPERVEGGVQLSLLASVGAREHYAKASTDQAI